MRFSTNKAASQGITLMETVTVVVIISIIAVLIFPLTTWYTEKAKRVACGQNLKALYMATSDYLNASNGVWPNIPWKSKEQQEYARNWYETLKPYGISWNTFICPSVQSKYRNPDFTQARYNRTDYIAMVFDSKPWTARKWPNQPWFNERQDIHGGGQLLILTNGSLVDLQQARKLGMQPQGSNP